MSHEKAIRVPNGWAILPVTIALFLGSIALLVHFVFDAVAAESATGSPTSGSCWAAASSSDSGCSPASGTSPSSPMRPGC